MAGKAEMVKSTVHNEASNAVSIGYMPGLDGLRALAVFAVIAYHLGVTWTPGGLLGVNLFFVLSGYLITSILYKQLESEGSIDLKDFWPQRFIQATGILYFAKSPILRALALRPPWGIFGLWRLKSNFTFFGRSF